MLEVINHTKLAAGVYPSYSRHGQQQFTAVTKASFEFDQFGRLSQIPAMPIQEHDEWLGEPDVSSLKSASEIVPFKQGAEILLQGKVVAPHPHYNVIDVELSVQSDHIQWCKPLRIFGERQWKHDHLKSVISFPKSLASLDIRYEHAFGGVCQIKQRSYAKNPAGKGYCSRLRAAKTTVLPQIEYADKLMRYPTQKLMPAGYGPIPLQWAPRNKLVNKNFWNSLMRGKYPSQSLPENYYNVAPTDQQFSSAFIGGEQISLRGLIKGVSLNRTVKITLPIISPQAKLITGTVNNMLALTCDTCHIDITNNHLSLVWRATIEANAINIGTTWLEMSQQEAAYAIAA